ncbi:MAG TPA: 3'-5' exonuclease, partial [Trebonia sp.]|nr:3'-5' exonuclease [Trebonia sp.]
AQAAASARLRADAVADSQQSVVSELTEVHAKAVKRFQLVNPGAAGTISIPVTLRSQVPMTAALPGAFKGVLPAATAGEPAIGGPASQPAGGWSVSGLLAEAARRAAAESRNAAVTDEAQRAEALAAVKTAADVLGPLAARCGTDLDRFLDELALGAEVDTWDPRADRISLLTLHAAKGLEFPVVFIVGCDDGLLPLRAWRGSEVDYAEERRLLFVGMTRATTRLTLFTAAKRTLRGEVTSSTSSSRCAASTSASTSRIGLVPDWRTPRAAATSAGTRAESLTVPSPTKQTPSGN